MIKKQKLGIKILIVALGAILILSSFIGCVTEEGKGTLVFADLTWDSAMFHNRIAGFILEHGYDYDIEYIPGSTIPLFAGLAAGDIDISMEIWVLNQKEALETAIEAGQVVDLGPNFEGSWQGWLVPTYMIEDGDLPADISVEDMPQYWELFKDPEDPTKGRFYNGDPGWECTKVDEEKFEAYGLNESYNIFTAGSSEALTASMSAAYEKHEPWFGYNWTPTYIMGKLNMTVVEEPPFDQEVWDTNRCCGWAEVPIHVVVNTSLMDEAPEVVTFLTKYETTADMTSKALVYMDENKASYEEAAVWFLQNYESLWTQWVSSDVASKVKAALP